MIFNQAITTLTSITISWTAPSDGSGAIVEYLIQYTYHGTNTTLTTNEEMYTLQGMLPSTRVDFFVSAVSNCSVVGEASTAVEFTDNIRKYII